MRKWIFENPTNCAAAFGGLGFLFGATVEGGGLISSLIWGGVMGVLIYFTVRFFKREIIRLLDSYYFC